MTIAPLTTALSAWLRSRFTVTLPLGYWGAALLLLCAASGTAALKLESWQAVQQREQQQSALGIWTDQATGLTWMKDGKSVVNWRDAAHYCKALHVSGYNGWQLPDRNELGLAWKHRPSLFHSVFGYVWTTNIDVADSSKGEEKALVFDPDNKDKRWHYMPLRSDIGAAMCVHRDDYTRVF
jgi:Protein of unknown function (DUF1566)